MREETVVSRLSPVYPRLVPFCVYAAFIAFKEVHHAVFGALSEHGLITVYFGQISCTVAALYVFRRAYGEIDWRDVRSVKGSVVSLLVGVLVFVVWVTIGTKLLVMDGMQPMDVSAVQPDGLRIVFVAVRLLGAVVVVPIMEELFWRSFLLRYLVQSDFMAVPLGRYTLFSFAAVSLLFGLEHTFIFSGVVAGCLYNLVLYRTKSLAQCIVSHAATNLLLSAYVLYTGEWRFW